MTEDEYALRLVRERLLGKETVRQQCLALRRRWWAPEDDPITRETDLLWWANWRQFVAEQRIAAAIAQPSAMLRFAGDVS